MKRSVRYLGLGQFVTRVAWRGRLALGGLSVIWVSLPDFRIGSMALVTSLARGVSSDSGVLGASAHCRRFAADDPQESEQSVDGDGDAQEVQVFPIHKATRA